MWPQLLPKVICGSPCWTAGWLDSLARLLRHTNRCMTTFKKPDTHTHTRSLAGWLERKATRWARFSTLSPIFFLCVNLKSVQSCVFRKRRSSCLAGSGSSEMIQWQTGMHSYSSPKSCSHHFLCLHHPFVLLCDFFKQCEPPKIFYFRKHWLVFLPDLFQRLYLLIGPQTDSLYIRLFITVALQVKLCYGPLMIVLYFVWILIPHGCQDVSLGSWTDPWVSLATEGTGQTLCPPAWTQSLLFITDSNWWWTQNMIKHFKWNEWPTTNRLFVVGYW